MSDLSIAQYGAAKMPLDAVTRTFGILGQRGTGKTNAAVVLMEQMAGAGGNVAVFDPVGAHYGITRQGKSKGIPGVVIGGEFGDVPLEETGGQLVAELIVARHWPVVVVDMKLLRKGAQMRFLADCLEGLFHSNREPLHVVFEEADRMMPQEGRSKSVEASRTLGAGEDIVKLGRSRGLGATLVTQRPATLNKNVLEQVENLLVMRLMGPNDQKAVKVWIEANGDPEKTKEFMSELGKLPRGEGWLYSPAFIEYLGRIKVKERQTFDSSATPEVGVTRVEPTKRAPVDLEEVREKMSETIERAKAEDPKELRKEIAGLKRQLAAASTVTEAEMKKIRQEAYDHGVVIGKDRAEVKEVPALEKDEIDRVEGALANLRDIGSEIAGTTEELQNALEMALQLRKGNVDYLGPVPTDPPSPPTIRSMAPYKPPEQAPNANGELNMAAMEILNALASFPEGLTRSQISLLTGRKARGGSWWTAVKQIVDGGYATDLGDQLQITSSGSEKVPEAAPLSQDEIISRWRSSFSVPARELLDIMLAEPDTVYELTDLAARTGRTPRGGSWWTAVKSLRESSLVEVMGKDQMKLSPDFSLTAR